MGFAARRRAISVILALVLALVLARGGSAFAQAPEIIPPAAQGNTEVPYPAAANGDADVILEIVVEKDGTVSHAEVIEGVEPFAEQARLAVLGWRFLPARRGGVAIAVRTRARVAFRQELEESAAPRSPSSSRSPASSADESTYDDVQTLPANGPLAETATDEVTVRGKRKEIGVMTLSASEVREMPGAFGDPFRAIEALPGVTPMLSGLPYFFIRGAPPNNNGYFLDGVRVPLLFHVGLGPGVIHPELLDRVDLYSGAAPARYGRFAGAVVAGHTREPSASFHGAANLRLVDAGALLESPFAEGRGSALVSGRYGYPGPVAGAFSDIKLGYWDYQSRVAWRIGERDTVSVFAFGSHDHLAHTDESTKETVEDFVSDFHRVDLRWDRTSSDGRVRVAATLGHDSQGAEPTYLTNASGAVRAELEKKVASGVRLRGGADVRLDAYRLQQRVPLDPEQPIVPSGVDPAPTNFAWGGHADVVWKLTSRVELVPGVRVDVFEASRRERGAVERSHTRVPAIDPRLSTRVTIAPSVALLSSLGLAHQYPTLRVGNLPAAVVSGSGFLASSSRLQRVAQASQGVEVLLPAELLMTASGFLSSWTGLTDLTANCVQIEPPILGPPLEPPPGTAEGPRAVKTPWTCPNEQLVHGRAFGVEILLRRPLSKRLSGLLSYTLSRSTRETRFVRLDGDTALATVPSEFDRTHVLNAILAYDLGRRWRVGSRFVLYSGAPYSRLAGNVPVPPYNSLRDPPFIRLDLRIEKRWRLGEDGSIAFVFEGQNLTLSKERTALGTDCVSELGPEGGTTDCKRAEIGPITIPSLGVEAFF